MSGRRVAVLEISTGNNDRRLAAQPNDPAVSFAPKARFAIDDAGARKEYLSQIVPGLMQHIPDVRFHRPQIFHAVHMTVWIGLAVVPHVRARLREVRPPARWNQSVELRKLANPRRRDAQTHLGRKRGDAPPCWIGIVAGVDVDQAGMPDSRRVTSIAGQKGMSALAHNVIGGARGIEGFGKVGFAVDMECAHGIEGDVRALQLDIVKWCENARGMLEVGPSHTPMPHAEMDA